MNAIAVFYELSFTVLSTLLFLVDILQIALPSMPPRAFLHESGCLLAPDFFDLDPLIFHFLYHLG